MKQNKGTILRRSLGPGHPRASLIQIEAEC